MTPREKAIELCDKYFTIMQESSFINDIEATKQCAIIAVDEICEAINWHEFESPNKEWEYWNKVKQEIENL